jgi:DnaD/phage-associated family protein
MGFLTIQDNRLSGMTVIPDDFIDYYMPRANGEFVKIYLYLLRHAHAKDVDPTPSALADIFSLTEKDVLRALRYWERAGLLSLTFHNKELSGIALLSVSPNLKVTQNDPEDPSMAEKEEKKQKPLAQISASRAKELKDDSDARQILFFTEQYIGHPLSATDMRRILYFYDELHFPIDLIDYLVEYCVSRGGRSMNYIEKVGLAWKEEGLDSVKAAKEYASAWRAKYFTIFKAFGIRNRNPIPDETAIMDRWLNDYGFSMELIKAAASRTVKQTGQPSFPYAERILSDWHQAGVTSLADIDKLDEAHRQQNGKPAGQSTSSRKEPKYVNFEQRDYDFQKLEQDLLNSQNES